LRAAGELLAQMQALVRVVVLEFYG